MQKNTLYLLLITFMLTGLFTACGGKDEDASENENKSALENAADQMDQAADDMSNVAEEMAEAFGDSDREPVPPVSFRVLMEYLPETILDLKREDLDGESATMGNWSYSHAEADYVSEDGDMSVEIEIHDYAYISMLYAPYRMMLKMGYERESMDGYERSTEFKGFPGYEKWNEPDMSGEANVLVADRFIVIVTTEGMPDAMTREIIQMLDLESLSSEKTEPTS